jgi:enoyl-CoA hydratase
MAVNYERRGSAAIVTIDRPEARNAVDGEAALALRAHYQAFVADDDARVLIVTGAGGEAFCAGADLKKLSNPGGPEGPMGFTRLLSPKPTIAAIDGWCVAGGLEIACWCDIRVAGEGSHFGCLERRWGVPLIDGGTVRLPLIVGLGRALDLILTGRTIDVAEAHAIGLVNRIAPKGGALNAALEIAEAIAGSPWATVISDRRSVYAALDLSLDEALKRESQFGREAAMTDVSRFVAGEGRHGGAKDTQSTG